MWSGRSTTVSISFGMALVAGRKRVPRPATGKTALRIDVIESLCARRCAAVAALLPLALLSGVAQAQDDRYPQLAVPITGSIGTQSDTWSGEPGASGHP